MEDEEYNEDLSDFDDEFNNLPDEPESNGGGGFKDIPDGNYVVNVEKVMLGETQGGIPKLSWWLRILSSDDGNPTGGLMFATNFITQGKGIEFLKKNLVVCGLRLSGLNELKGCLGDLLDTKLKVTQKANGEYKNIFFNSKTEFDGEQQDAVDEDIPF